MNEQALAQFEKVLREINKLGGMVIGDLQGRIEHARQIIDGAFADARHVVRNDDQDERGGGG